MKKQLSLLGAFLVISITFSCIGQNSENKELEVKYDTVRKKATKWTSLKQKKVAAKLNFNPDSIQNSEDYKNAMKGFIATLEGDGTIPVDARLKKNIVYDTKAYEFLDEPISNEANPSLWRQSKLNKINGLFRVTKDIYQIRGFDLANMTLIKGKTGWIIVDPLGSPETAKAGIDLANERLHIISSKKGVSAVIFTHSHIDHFGGIEGVMLFANNKDIPIYTPKGFFEEAISENVMAGNAMGRRASYMYGNILTAEPKGTLGTGLGQTSSTGLAGIKEGTIIIDDNKKTNPIRVDGVKVHFIYTPEAEAPAEMMFYLPELKAFCQAEEINHTLHNLYTLRGAKVRNGQKWSQYIDEVIQKWGGVAEVSFGSHHWPTWDTENINKLWENQRDVYRFIHDQTLRLANTGKTPREIANRLKLPKAIDNVFENRGYYGTVSHNARAQYQLYFGWFDGNPSNLSKLSPVKAGKRYVEFMGGEINVINQASKSFKKGQYRWVAEVMSHVVFANPQNKQAKYLLADAYEQLGYQAESGPWRNFYLSGAKELRSPNTPEEDNAGSETVVASGDMVSGMSNELLFNYLAMRFNGLNAAAAKFKYNFQFVFSDTNDKVALIVQNGVVTPRMNYSFPNEDITQKITINSRDVLDTIITSSDIQDAIKDAIDKGGITIESFDSEKPNAFNNFIGKLDPFKFWFNIVTP